MNPRRLRESWETKFSKTLRSVNLVFASLTFSPYSPPQWKVLPEACSMPRVSMPRAGEDGFVLGGEVVSHDADDADLGKVAGGEREVGGRAAENLFPRPPKGVFRVSKATEPTTRMTCVMYPPASRYLPTIRSRAWRASGGDRRGAVMMAVASACPHLQPRLGPGRRPFANTLAAFSAFWWRTATICSTVTLS